MHFFLENEKINRDKCLAFYFEEYFKSNGFPTCILNLLKMHNIGINYYFKVFTLKMFRPNTYQKIVRLTIKNLSFIQVNSRALTKTSNEEHSNSFNIKWVYYFLGKERLLLDCPNKLICSFCKDIYIKVLL